MTKRGDGGFNGGENERMNVMNIIFNEWNVEDVRYKIVINFGAWFRGIILMEKFEFVINLIHYYHFTLQVRMF